MRKFPLNQVLTVTTGRLLCDIDSVYKILNYLTGDNLFTHQLPRAMQFCQPVLLEKYPELAKIDTWEEANLPGEYALSPLEGWKPRNPIKEAEEMVGKEKIITVKR